MWMAERPENGTENKVLYDWKKDEASHISDVHISIVIHLNAPACSKPLCKIKKRAE
jgi:hypothetical protein